VNAEVPVYVAAGSNVEAARHLAFAIGELEREFGSLSVSQAYRNQAVGFDGPDFINLVVGFRTRLSVDEVIERLRGIERRCGRPADAPKWAPRTMDLDILLYGDLVADEHGRRIPRPDLLRRAYMLRPLAEIAPALRHPTTGKTLGELWAAFDRAAHPLHKVELARDGRDRASHTRR
jgi:2-amino-4-hydroxy-6-hydroxymethyldihydropteridine diphosphokinase